MKKTFIKLAVLSLFLGGCSETEDVLPEPNRAMNFQALLPNGIRVTETSFEKGDGMGIYVTEYNGEKPLLLQYSGNYGDNVRTVFDGSSWKTEYPIYWKSGKFDVYAYYPYRLPNSVEKCRFSVSLDQSASKTAAGPGGYEASDFLWARSAGVSQSASPVPLVFTHRMSRLSVNIQKGPDYKGAIPDDITVSVHNVITEAFIDLATGSVIKDGHASRKSIRAKKVSNTQFDAIIVPQRMETRLPVLEVQTQGVSYLVEGRLFFKAGTRHTFDVIINGNPDQIKIEIGGEIENGWNE